MARTDDDLELVAASRSGDASSFGELVRRYQDRLYPTLLRLTGSAEDARDLLQESFFRAYQKLDRFHGESSFYTWIYRIAVNLTLSNRRRRRPPVRLSLDGRDAPEAPDDLDSSDPARPLEQAERDAQVQSALMALPPDARAVLVMKEIEGLRYEQIAEALGVPVGTVRSRLHRARADLRERLRAIMDPELSLVSRRP